MLLTFITAPFLSQCCWMLPPVSGVSPVTSPVSPSSEVFHRNVSGPIPGLEPGLAVVADAHHDPALGAARGARPTLRPGHRSDGEARPAHEVGHRVARPVSPAMDGHVERDLPWVISFHV